MKEILNELENKNEISLASINNKKHDKTNNMQYIFSVHIIYIYFARNLLMLCMLYVIYITYIFVYMLQILQNFKY